MFHAELSKGILEKLANWQNRCLCLLDGNSCSYMECISAAGYASACRSI